MFIIINWETSVLLLVQHKTCQIYVCIVLYTELKICFTTRSLWAAQRRLYIDNKNNVCALLPV